MNINNINTEKLIKYIEAIKSPEETNYSCGRNQMADQIIDYLSHQEKITTVGQLIKELEYYPMDMRIATDGFPYDSIEIEIKHDDSQDFDYVALI